MKFFTFIDSSRADVVRTLYYPDNLLSDHNDDTLIFCCDVFNLVDAINIL